MLSVFHSAFCTAALGEKVADDTTLHGAVARAHSMTKRRRTRFSPWTGLMAILETLAQSEGMTLFDPLPVLAGPPIPPPPPRPTVLPCADHPANSARWWTVRPSRASLARRRRHVPRRARGVFSAPHPRWWNPPGAPMQALMRDSGETANLGVEQQDEVFVPNAGRERIRRFRAFFPPGTIGPMHVSGIRLKPCWHGFWTTRGFAQVVARRGFAGFLHPHP